MASKKVQKYVPQTKFPTSGRSIEKIIREKYSPAQFIDLLRKRHALSDSSNYYYWGNLVRNWDRGTIDASNFNNHVDERVYRRIAQYVFLVTDEWKALNEQFLEEYNSRADLQEIYMEAMKGSTYIYDHDECVTLHEGHEYKKAPKHYNMFVRAIKWDSSVTQKIEVSRETPYQEGDLVLLRVPSIGYRDYDPMYVNPYSAEYYNGARTPDKTVPRIGTVISVTEKVAGWRHTKGDKIIKVMWMGVGDGKIFDIPEKHIKWHCRPTKANGMKV